MERLPFRLLQRPTWRRSHFFSRPEYFGSLGESGGGRNRRGQLTRLLSLTRSFTPANCVLFTHDIDRCLQEHRAQWDSLSHTHILLPMLPASHHWFICEYRTARPSASPEQRRCLRRREPKFLFSSLTLPVSKFMHIF